MNGLILEWFQNNGSIRRTFSGHSNAVTSLKLIQDGYLASGSADFKIMLWNMSTNTLVKDLNGHTGSVLTLETFQGKI